MSVEALVKDAIGELVPMPRVAAEVMERIGHEATTAGRLNDVICQDQALASRVLKIANAPFYSAGKPVTSVRSAVVRVGFNTIQSIVVAASIRGMYRTFGRHEESLWEHSVGAAYAARAIALRTRACNSDQAYLGGLLHDIGKTILLLKCRDRMGPIIDRVVGDPGRAFGPLEEEAFGFDHSALGHLLARSWKFGEGIEEAIDKHHDPDGARHSPGLARVVCLANAVCHVLGLGPGTRKTLDTQAVDCANRLGLDAERLDALMTEVEEGVGAERSALAG